jgi:Uma2 family endonuclease
MDEDAMTPTATKLITAEEFARMPNPEDGSQQELVRGEIVTMPPPGFLHGKVQKNVCFILESFNRSKRMGHVTVESGVPTTRSPDTVRGPDVAYWSYEKIPSGSIPDGWAEVPPDLCVEVLSPNDTQKKTNEKVREYLQRGVRMVWVVHPENRTVVVFRKSNQGWLLIEDATINGEDVLPGFQCLVSEFFAE